MSIHVKIVFLGDSLTEGREGAPYLHALQRRVTADAHLRAVCLVNAGVGGDTVVNLARRIPREVIPLEPAWVVVQVGLNDATTYLLRHALPTPRTLLTRRYFRRHKRVRAIAPGRFADGLRVVVDMLATRTTARIALCTPTTLGESPQSRRARLLDEYARVVRQVARERGCALIDVHAAFAARLGELPSRSQWSWVGARLARLLPAAAYDRRARLSGYTYVFDGVHLTDRGAELVADVLYAWLCARVVTGTPSPHQPA